MEYKNTTSLSLERLFGVAFGFIQCSIDFTADLAHIIIHSTLKLFCRFYGILREIIEGKFPGRSTVNRPPPTSSESLGYVRVRHAQSNREQTTESAGRYNVIFGGTMSYSAVQGGRPRLLQCPAWQS